MSTDDFFLPHYVEKVRAAATARPDATWFYGESAATNDGDQKWWTADLGHVDGNLWQDFRNAEFKLNLNGMAIRRGPLLEIGGWDEAMAIEDIDLVFRLAERGSTCAKIPEPIAVYRSNPDGVSRNLDFMRRGVSTFFAKHSRHFPYGGRMHLGDSIRQMAARCTDTGDYRQAARLLWHAFVAFPFNARLLRTAAYLGRRAVAGSASATDSQGHRPA
jgi:GT2 family glycosyltransferase